MRTLLFRLQLRQSRHGGVSWLVNTQSNALTAKRCINWSGSKLALRQSHREITCQVCGSPLVGREGKFVLKYFLLREAVRRRRKGRAKAV